MATIKNQYFDFPGELAKASKVFNDIYDAVGVKDVAEVIFGYMYAHLPHVLIKMGLKHLVDDTEDGLHACCAFGDLSVAKYFVERHQGELPTFFAVLAVRYKNSEEFMRYALSLFDDLDTNELLESASRFSHKEALILICDLYYDKIADKSHYMLSHITFDEDYNKCLREISNRMEIENMRKQGMSEEFINVWIEHVLRHD